MTGIKPHGIMMAILGNDCARSPLMELSHTRASQLIKIEEVQTRLDEMHKEVEERVSSQRKNAIERHNRATNLQQPNFNIGDLVLVRRSNKNGHKLSFKWCGPRRIIGTAGPLVFVVQKLTCDDQERVHCARLTLYSSELDGKEVPQEILDLADRSESRYEILERIVGLSENHEGIWFHLQWDGLPDKRDYTWAPAKDIYEDVPEMVLEFLRSTKNKRLVSKVTAQLGISL